jgi:cytochrome b
MYFALTDAMITVHNDYEALSMNNKIYVWDPLLRIFHWTLVAAFTLSYLTGEEETIWHIYSGYTILGLLVFRLVWGLIGSKYSRFGSLILAPAAAFAYLRSLFGKGETKDYLGHNPAGSWMVVFLLLSLSMTVFSGLKAYGEEGHGPLAQGAPGMEIQLITSAYAHGEEEHDDDEGEEHEGDDLWEEVHEVFVNLTLLLVLLHIAGVIISSRKHHENLVKAMFTGYKTREK